MYAFLRGLMRVITRTWLAGIFRVEGREQVPRTGGLLVAANHSSTADPPMVPAFLPRGDTFSIAKSEYFRPGPARFLFEWYQAFPVVRHTADRKAIRRALEILGGGHVLVMYPEGTRVHDGKLRRPEPGAGFLALQSGVPVQPVALIGTDAVFPKGRLIPRRSPVRLRFGTPFRVARRRADGSRTDHQDASDAIMVRVAEMLPPEQRGEFEDLDSWRSKVADVYEPV